MPQSLLLFLSIFFSFPSTISLSFLLACFFVMWLHSMVPLLHSALFGDSVKFFKRPHTTVSPTTATTRRTPRKVIAIRRERAFSDHRRVYRPVHVENRTRVPVAPFESGAIGISRRQFVKDSRSRPVTLFFVRNTSPHNSPRRAAKKSR